ncbi:MAG: Cell division ATP-binding protein FtsE [Candidatus Moranbacteria bacterium GW2011_GWF2_36_839]|nr:MAG: Cell division ATP-binding protein FtsE [Candidatus Moranbacteria bacterium GW2011_GWF1_36_78]KKQ17032.1 MAG: Cell division ATP-binding protein FtsE [Candidatus Moranbacteria bacterium GW2011_GWF2_36_839]
MKRENKIKNEESSEEKYSREMEEEHSPVLIKFDHVSKFFKNDQDILTDINLEIRKGEFVSIVGHSGAGKSTFLKLIYAEEMPTEGSVYFDGVSLDMISRRKLPYHRRRIGTIFQDFKLLSKKTVFENVAYAMEVCGAPRNEILEDVPQILDIVGLGDKMEKFPRQLSGGEQQRVVLARALIHKPHVIAADEPTGNLDPVSSMEMVKLLLDINKLGTTVILASHDHDIVNKAAKRVIVLDHGKIICDDAKGKYKIC